jgi:DNA-binding NarL/FixJ family response regulator
MKVFIAEDSSIVRERLASFLREIRGLEVVGSESDAQEAAQSIQRLRPDVVLLDFRMPGGSGLAVLQMIKQQQPEIIVIIFTNLAADQFRKKCLDAGADFFFDKSTDFERVLDVFANLSSKTPAARRGSK